MKHGRRHDKLKEQAYLARKDAEGYGRAYRPLPVEGPTGAHAPEPLEDAPLAARLSTKEKKRLRFLGVEPESPE